MAFKYLFAAPQVVKQTAPMSWQYLEAPTDGTVFLTWSGGRMASNFPTDGYVWADKEEHFSQPFAGYTVEIAIHNSGFRPSIDQTACHSRRRYRLVAKSPGVAANPPDTNLWIVHYSQAEQQFVIPVSNVPVSPQASHHLQERAWIERQGRLERQDFMLHDREKWPQLNFPGRGAGAQAYAQQPNYYNQQTQQNLNPMAHIGNPRFSGQFYQQGQQAMAGPSPAKRQRQNPPTQMPGNVAAIIERDTTIEDEENAVIGDLLDQLSQRDISLSRYVQHHEWMEEVFSSPYATGRIIPVDLGFGLMGELAGLTDGLFDRPSSDEKALDKEPSFTKVESDQLEEFEKRVSTHLEKEQAELDRMKSDHAKAMERFRRTKTLSQAEKKLRNAAWSRDGNGAANGHTYVDDIVGEVETLLGGTVQSQKEATMLERGGLREKIQSEPAVSVQATDGAMDMTDGSGLFEESQPAHSKPQMQDTYAQQQAPQLPPLTNLPQPQPQQPLDARPQQLPAPPGPVAQDGNQEQNDTSTQDVGDMDDMTNMDNMEAMGDTDMSLMEGMDLDVEGTNFDLDTTGDDFKLDGNDWGATDDNIATGGDKPPQTSGNAGAAAAGNQQSGAGDLYGDGDTGLGDFDAGDGLIDFDGGDGGDIDFDLGIDNSAFGEAFGATQGDGEDEGGV